MFFALHMAQIFLIENLYSFLKIKKMKMLFSVLNLFL